MRENAALLFHEKRTHEDGVIKIVIWPVPGSVPPSEHRFKYRLVFAPYSEIVVDMKLPDKRAA